MTVKPSARAAIVEARTYLRPLDSDGTVFETPVQAAERVIEHQRWLWKRAKAGMRFYDGGGLGKVWALADLTPEEEAELQELKELFLDRKATVSGRTRWLGGTEIAKTRESSQFNCSFLEIRTVHDIVDAQWLLLQGCGVGFRPVTGSLSGFARKMEIEIIRSQRGPNMKGPEKNEESFNPKTGEWVIKVGDSSEAWAKLPGKLLAGKYPASKLIIDMRYVRGAGGRLKNYGWISSGDNQLAIAMKAVAEILNRCVGDLLSPIDILDIMNWLGTILSSRRSSEIALMAYGEPGWEEFAVAKKNHFENGQPQRSQSNNSLMFYQKPTKYEIKRIFKLMLDAGGSEPGFINAAAALKRAKWFKGGNPCMEILLGDKSFCNLVETVLCRFNDDLKGLHRAHWLVARANYRQTCVDLRDGILQHGWHELNEFLRLCGVGVTGVVSWEHAKEPFAWTDLRITAKDGVDSMAYELNMPCAKAVTTIKPSGTQSKTMGIEGMEIPEGLHMPLGQFIFNRVRFSMHDPILVKLIDAGYDIEVDPYNAEDRLAVLPVEFTGLTFDLADGNIPIALESALDQLERYKLVMDNYVDYNASITVSYDRDEVPEIIDWLIANWDHYVGVSFILRQDVSKIVGDDHKALAASLGYPYLPQQIVSERAFSDYTSRLKPVDFTGTASNAELESMEGCVSGACPIR